MPRSPAKSLCFICRAVRPLHLDPRRQRHSFSGGFWAQQGGTGGTDGVREEQVPSGSVMEMNWASREVDEPMGKVLRIGFGSLGIRLRPWVAWWTDRECQ